MTLQVWMSGIQERTEAALVRHLPAADKTPFRLHDAMRYAALGGGKRVRPLLCHAAGAIFGAPSEMLDTCACAIELIHVYSLVHDDLPAMDNDVLRRGKPTVHIEFDEATALLVGDALQSRAFELLATPFAGIPAERQLEMTALLAAAAGSVGMAGGQAIDLESVGKSLSVPELEFMHMLKTGALIRAAVLLGALAGGASGAEVEALTRFANRAGLLFQVVDDILDATADTATLGKTAGKDAAADKPTYVTLLGLKPARELANTLHGDALTALTPFGDRAIRLRELSDYILGRTF